MGLREFKMQFILKVSPRVTKFGFISFLFLFYVCNEIWARDKNRERKRESQREREREREAKDYNEQIFLNQILDKENVGLLPVCKNN